MKKKNRIIICTLIFIGLLSFFLSNCKKNNDSNDKNTVKDIEGNVYHTVTIGAQIWMVENLKVTKYRNGDAIGTTVPATLPTLQSEISYKYQWAYNGDESNVATYGRLYTWYAITDPRNVCPTGWHIPSNDEWIILEDFLRSRGYTWDGSTTNSAFAQSLASDAGWDSNTTIWCAVGYHDTIKLNTTGFTALPGGSRDPSGEFFSDGYAGFWWSSTEFSLSSYAYCRILFSDDCGLVINNDGKNSGLSVRCLKD